MGAEEMKKKKTEESPKCSISLLLFDLLELVPCFSSLHVIFFSSFV